MYMYMYVCVYVLFSFRLSVGVSSLASWRECSKTSLSLIRQWTSSRSSYRPAQSVLVSPYIVNCTLCMQYNTCIAYRYYSYACKLYHCFLIPCVSFFFLPVHQLSVLFFSLFLLSLLPCLLCLPLLLSWSLF